MRTLINVQVRHVHDPSTTPSPPFLLERGGAVSSAKGRGGTQLHPPSTSRTSNTTTTTTITDDYENGRYGGEGGGGGGGGEEGGGGGGAWTCGICTLVHSSHPLALSCVACGSIRSTGDVHNEEGERGAATAARAEIVGGRPRPPAPGKYNREVDVDVYGGDGVVEGSWTCRTCTLINVLISSFSLPPPPLTPHTSPRRRGVVRPARRALTTRRRR